MKCTHRSGVFGLCAVLLAGAGGVARAQSQTDSTAAVPYASMNPDTVAYRGPGRSISSDLPGKSTTIGMVLPLQGRHAAEGKSLLAAAQLALDEENAVGTLPDGKTLLLVVRDESERWGQASSSMVQLIQQEQAVALVTGFNGSIAHQAEQIANKISVPVFTLSSDASTTRINIPWVFRLGPSDADQARLIAEHIYAAASRKRILLIAQDDHDGRVGAEEFLRAAQTLHATAPDRLDISSTVDPAALVPAVAAKSSDAIVLWFDSVTTATLLPALRAALPTTPVYLCRKATALDAYPEQQNIVGGLATNLSNSAGIWWVTTQPDAEGMSAGRVSQHLKEKLGGESTPAQREMYELIRYLAAAIRVTGPNRARLRDYLSDGHAESVSADVLRFDPAGNSLSKFVLVRQSPLPIAVPRISHKNSDRLLLKL